MGTYTEILIKCDLDLLKLNADPVARAIVQYLFGAVTGEKPKELPDHEFFSSPRWDFIGRSSSYYHHPIGISSLRDSNLFSRSDLKNYGGEIANFFDWFRPFVDAHDEECIGYSWSEDDDAPTLIYKGDK